MIPVGFSSRLTSPVLANSFSDGWGLSPSAVIVMLYEIVPSLRLLPLHTTCFSKGKPSLQSGWTTTQQEFYLKYFSSSFLIFLKLLSVNIYSGNSLVWNLVLPFFLQKSERRLTKYDRSGIGFLACNLFISPIIFLMLISQSFFFFIVNISISQRMVCVKYLFIKIIKNSSWHFMWDMVLFLKIRKDVLWNIRVTNYYRRWNEAVLHIVIYGISGIVEWVCWFNRQYLFFRPNNKGVELYCLRNSNTRCSTNTFQEINESPV